MFIYLRIFTTLFVQRWQAIREDEKGASTIEYLLLVMLGVTVAGLAFIAIRQAVTNKDNDIVSGSDSGSK
jgi:Flp pilus assembly pilin Flp